MKKAVTILAILLLVCMAMPLIAAPEKEPKDETNAVGSRTTHVVGPGGLPDVNSALSIASEGDIIRIYAGTYSPFTVGIAGS